MKFLNKKYSLYTSIIIFSFILFSCNNKPDETLDTDYKGNAQISFEKENRDLGTLKEGEKVAVNFYFKNTGKGELIIVSTDSDCGCTTVDTENKRYKPNEKGKVSVIFDSHNLRNNQYKTIKVFTNTEDSVTELHIAAFIESKFQLNK